MSSLKTNVRILIAINSFLYGIALADTAPDPTGIGPLATTSAEYRFPAAVDPDVLGDRATEIWARVYMPADLSAGPYPVLVFKHGNHGTCGRSAAPRIDDNIQYTTTGTCPGGYVVTPNHEGYAYIADRLASWGYIVVSINSNRGITAGGGVAGDAGLNLARGRLILKHLQRLSEWNTTPGSTPPSVGVDLFGKLDFSNVGLLGHSRGGEGVRAAYQQYRDAGSPWPARIPDPVTFKAIFEIGAVDGQTSRVLNADGTVWNQLLPFCDGDVSDLQGVKPFDRMMLIRTESPATQKSTFAVWGTNHNFYNTEWQVSDSPLAASACGGHARIFPTIIGSAQQRQPGMTAAMALFRGNVGAADPTFNQNFNPQFDLPALVPAVTRVDRGYTDSPNSAVTTTFEDFDQPTGTSSYGFPNDASNISIAHQSGSPPNHAPAQRAAAVSWTTAGSTTFFQTNWRAAGVGADVSTFATLDIRISRQSSPLNPGSPTNFSIALAQADGSLSSSVQLTSYTDLRGPISGPGGIHPILQTARIRLSDFAGADLTQVHGIRFTFDDTNSGAIYLANVRLSTISGLGASVAANSPRRQALSDARQQQKIASKVITSGNQIQGIASVGSKAGLRGKGNVEISLFNPDGFPVQDELAVLRIGGEESILSSMSSDARTLMFLLTPEQFARTKAGDRVTVQYGRNNPLTVWDFHKLGR